MPFKLSGQLSTALRGENGTKLELDSSGNQSQSDLVWMHEGIRYSSSRCLGLDPNVGFLSDPYVCVNKLDNKSQFILVVASDERILADTPLGLMKAIYSRRTSAPEHIIDEMNKSSGGLCLLKSN